MPKMPEVAVPVVSVQVTGLQVLTIRPGDRLVAYVDRDSIDARTAAEVKKRLREALDLPASMPIVIASREWRFETEPG
jgi:hypothetical protein